MPYIAYTINLEVYPHKDYLRSRILIDSSDKNITKLMKSHRSIIKIVSIDKFKGGTYVDFLNTYRGSIAGLLYDREVLILGNIIENEMEKWSFVTSNKNIKEIVNEAKNLGKVVDVKVADYDPMLYPSLTDIEKKVILMAYNYGYLDYPRRITADELAELMKMSKVTFLYHLRNAQKKLIRFSIKNMLT